MNNDRLVETIPMIAGLVEPLLRTRFAPFVSFVSSCSKVVRTFDGGADAPTGESVSSGE
jgi:hypothetical protein